MSQYSARLYPKILALTLVWCCDRVSTRWIFYRNYSSGASHALSLFPVQLDIPAQFYMALQSVSRRVTNIDYFLSQLVSHHWRYCNSVYSKDSSRKRDLLTGLVFLLI